MTTVFVYSEGYYADIVVHVFPVAALLVGGYAKDTRDTVTIHVNTCLAAIDCFG